MSIHNTHLLEKQEKFSLDDYHVQRLTYKCAPSQNSVLCQWGSSVTIQTNNGGLECV